MPKRDDLSHSELPEELSVLHELWFSIGTSLNLKKEMNSFLHGLSDKFSCDRATIHLLKEGELVLGASSGLSRKEHEKEAQQPLRSPLLEEALSTGSAVNVCDRNLSKYPSQLLIPLKRHDENVGVLWLARREPRPFTEKEVTIMQSLLDRIAISMDRSLMYQKLEKQNQDLKTLYGQVIKVKADWQNTFDSIPDMICILDREARITRVNRAFSVRMNKSYHELIGASCHEIIHGMATPPEMCPFSTVLQTSDPVGYEMEIQIGDSLFETSLFPYLDSSGDVQGAVHIFRDVTDQKALKQKLLHSEKMAAIGTLAAEIAHEINNPLDYINNYLYLLSETLPDDFDKKEYLDKIEAGIDNLATLTRDLLEFARPQIDAFGPQDMHTVIEHSLEFSGKYLAEKQVQITKQYGCPEKKVLGSGRMLQQVMLNLILNSLDAMPDGGTITIATKCENDMFIMEFTDTGVGIPEVNRSRIFEPFFTTKKTSGKRGSGLGLSICYNIINQHNGDIRVSSNEGEDTTFTVVLPLAVSGKVMPNHPGQETDRS